MSFSRALCPYCKVRLRDLDSVCTRAATDAGFAYAINVALGTCPLCGWWAIGVHDILDVERYFHVHAVLEKCDVATVDGATDELQRYLLNSYKQRFDVEPRAFEDVVGQVFRNNGYDAQVTAPSNDRGIDLYVGIRNGTCRGVQVKRSKNKIEVSLIREFAGSLMLGRLTSGVFITTSSFTSGAISAAKEYHTLQNPMRIELFDAERFYRAMSFRSSPIYSSAADPAAPFHEKWDEVLSECSRSGWPVDAGPFEGSCPWWVGDPDEFDNFRE